MASILTSGKQIVLEIPTPPSILLHQFAEQIPREDSIFSRLRNAYSIVGECVGKVDGREVQLKYLSGFHYPAELTMRIRVDTAPAGGSVIHARYTIAWWGKLFLIMMTLTFCTFTWNTLFIWQPDEAADFARMFLGISPPVYGLLMWLIIRLYAYREQCKMEKLLHKVIDSVGQRQQFERRIVC